MLWPFELYNNGFWPHQVHAYEINLMAELLYYSAASSLYLLFFHLLLIGCFNLISISGKSWIPSIIFVVAFLFLADRASSFNRGNRGGIRHIQSLWKTLFTIKVKVSRYSSPVFLCSYAFDEELRTPAQATGDTERCLAEGATWCPEAVHQWPTSRRVGRNVIISTWALLRGIWICTLKWIFFSC